eukprot:s34_g38.t4
MARSKVVLGLITVASLGRPKSFTSRSPCLRGRGSDGPDRRPGAKPRVVVLIDGDHIGPPWFEAIFEAAKNLGSVQASCFGAPHLAQRWKKVLKQWQVSFQPVQRENTTDPAADPNDLAIMRAADLIASASPSTIIAIASTDTDFLEYHLQLKRRGMSSLALVPYASDEKRCQQADVPVIRFQIPGTDPGFAEAFEDYFGRPYDEEEAEAVYAKVGEGLKRLGYLSEMEAPFPTTRALAIFFHVNELKERRLYPWSLAAFEALPFLSGAREVSAQQRFNFYEAFAGRRRAQDAWHVEEIAPGLTTRVLEWLGYKVDSTTFGMEEMDAFWRRNRKALRTNLKRSTLKLPCADGPEAFQERLAFLEQVFAHPQIRQQWRRPPDEAEIHLWLQRKKYLKSPAASKDEAYDALCRFLEERDMESVPKSYVTGHLVEIWRHGNVDQEIF